MERELQPMLLPAMAEADAYKSEVRWVMHLYL
jgi:hypothetical protein